MTDEQQEYFLRAAREAMESSFNTFDTAKDLLTCVMITVSHKRFDLYMTTQQRQRLNAFDYIITHLL